jgi:glycosyltransferase involved in cell wall biosynthesis
MNGKDFDERFERSGLDPGWHQVMLSTGANVSEMESSVPAGGRPIRLIHLVDSAGAADRLWGKENVIVSLMQAQRASGRIDPELVTFTPGLLDETMRAAGFRVHSLETEHRRLPTQALSALRAILAAGPPAIVHTHEYKANIVGRLSRASRAPMRRLVATCHGWVDHSPQLDVYYALDRLSAICSDVVTVTDPAMLALFPPFRPRRTLYVQNAIAQRAAPTAQERTAARLHFGFPAAATVIGSLGRLTKNKGILDILAAARRTPDSGIIWAIAGSGALTDEVSRCGLPNVRFVGYQADNDRYLAALDVYLQASYFEGLSLSLLESLRSGLPSISSKAGATEFAIRDAREALLVNAGDLDAIAGAGHRLRADGALRSALGSAARARFEEAFAIERQHEAFMNLYLAS